MASPALHRNVTLTSYSEASPNDSRPEDGLWRASPFCMGLNAWVTRETARLVHSLHFQGHWQQRDQADSARQGRLADRFVLLNIAIRAAVDRCVNLQSYKSVKSCIPGVRLLITSRWTLNTRPMSMLYSGFS